MNVISYVLTPGKRKRLRTMGFSLVCKKCQKPIEVGEKFARKKGGSHTSVYHLKCYQELFIETRASKTKGERTAA